MSAVAEHVGEVMCKTCGQWLPAQSKHHACPGLRANVPDRGLQADVALEVEIDAAWNLMKRAPTDRESQDALTEVIVLARRRSDLQLMKLEFELRALRGAT